MLKSRNEQAPIEHKDLKKRTYLKPRLVTHGSLAKLTRKTGAIPDKNVTRSHRM
jgi:hypothetical protein